MTRICRTGWVALLISAWSAPGFPSLSAQTLSTGELAGTVEDAGGGFLGGTVLTLTDLAGGLTRSAVATRSGFFHVGPLPPGEYRLLAEHLGYRPTLFLGVFVRAGTKTDVAVRLRAAPPPVFRVDTVPIPPGTSGAVGAGEWHPVRDLRWLPDPSGGARDVARLSTRTTPELAAEGLSDVLSGFLIDGIPYRPARNPGLPGGQLDSPVLRLSNLDDAELVTNGADAEWAGFGGATLTALHRLGTRDFQAHFLADGSGGSLSGSDYFDPGAVPHSSLRSALYLTGPVTDSAQFVFGLEGERLRTPMPAPLISSATADSLVTVAQDSFRVGLNAYLQPRVDSTDALTGFAGLDWRVTSTSDVAVDARYATATTRNADFGIGVPATLGAALDDRALLGGVTIRSTFSPTVSQELRAGGQVSTRTFAGATPAQTAFVDIGTSLGSLTALPGFYRRTVARLSDVVRADLGAHRLKFGADLALNSHDQTAAFGNPGAFTFAGSPQFGQRVGAYRQIVFSTPEVQFSVPQFGVYAQDLMSAAPGLDLLLGLRYDRENLPHGDVLANQSWRRASGLDNTAFPTRLNKVSPRLAVTWDAGERHTTLVRAVTGVYFDEFDPGILGEVIRESLGDTVRAAAGALGAWPTSPDSTHAPARGADLMLLAPRTQAPRTGRVDVSLLQQVTTGFTAMILGTYRHSDFLPRRANLNLLPTPNAHDQYGRPVFGTLLQQGDLVTVQPGTNARFAGFDVVSTINPDGYSDYWGLTLTVARQTGSGLRLFASYTYSRTTDNLLSAAGGVPGGGLSPFPDSLGGQDWADGRSDYEVPHRLVLAAELQTHLPLAPRLAAVYRQESGAPFTPGFRSGVDVSGTSSGSDPAFVDGSLPGVTNLLAAWDCLRSQVGRFAARNSCQDPGVHALDLRMTLDLVRFGHTPFVLVVDALNVLESDVGLRDHALALIDPNKALTVNAGTGVVNLPLTANPGFGNVLVHRSPGRELRIGLRVNY